MQTIEILYGGRFYRAEGRDIPELKSLIQQASASGGGWLSVSSGDGGSAPAELFVSPGVSIALIAVADGDEPLRHLRALPS